MNDILFMDNKQIKKEYEELTIISGNPTQKEKIKEYIRYREVFMFLAWKDIIVRYKQTVLGILWAIMQPVISMIIMTFIFGKVAKIDSGGVPYEIMVFAALIPWNFFSTGVNAISNCLIINSHLITKIYFPRLALPVSSLITACVDSLISLIVLALIMVAFMYVPPMRILLLPVFYILIFMIALGMGLILAALNVKYRDIKYLVPFLLQIGMYISPVGYSSSIIPESFKLLYSLNPLTGVIEGFRWCLIPSAKLYTPSIVISMLFAFVIMYGGIKFFNKFESSFADII